jgi:hypothetical protein
MLFLLLLIKYLSSLLRMSCIAMIPKLLTDRPKRTMKEMLQGLDSVTKTNHSMEVPLKHLLPLTPYVSS